jgi:hypothetical protein
MSHSAQESQKRHLSKIRPHDLAIDGIRNDRFTSTLAVADPGTRVETAAFEFDHGKSHPKTDRPTDPNPANPPGSDQAADVLSDTLRIVAERRRSS